MSLKQEAPHLLTLLKSLAARFELAVAKSGAKFPGRAYLPEMQAAIARAEAPEPPNLDKAYRCPSCGSANVEHSCWVDANTDEVRDVCGEDDSVYCRDCETFDSHFLMPDEEPAWPACKDCGTRPDPDGTDPLNDDDLCPSCARRQEEAMASREPR